MKKSFLKYILSAFLLVIAIIIVLKTESAEMLTRISLGGLGLVVLASFFVFASRGLMLGYLTKKSFGTKISIFDMVSLPVAMNFWSLIIPIKGGMLYQVFFLKMKYKITAAKGMSIAIYTYLLTLMITGVLGLYFCVEANKALSVGTLVSLILILSPLNLAVMYRILKFFKFEKSVFLRNIKELVDSTILNSNALFADIKTTLIIVLFTLGTIILRMLQYYWAAQAFNLEASVTAIILLSLIVTLGRVFTFTPNNIGVNELFSGGVFAVLGGAASHGIMIGLIVQVACLILNLTLGYFSTIKNLDYFDFGSLKTMWRALKQEKPI